jgi:chromosome partitioning protein
MCKIISVAAFKGGVGKTTSATNLAAAIKKINPAKVLLVDLDFQTNVSLAFGYGIVYKSMYQVLHGQEAIQDIILHHDSGIDIAPSSFDMCAFDHDLFTQDKFKDKAFVLRDILEPIKSKYDYIILDTPPALSMLATNYIVASDSILVVLQTGSFALAGALKLIERINVTRQSYTKDTYEVKMFATFFDSRTNISTDILQEARRYCDSAGIYLAENVISRTVKYNNAQAYDALPLVLIDDSSFAEQYIKLCKELIL